jgi:hypothetical protein
MPDSKKALRKMSAITPTTKIPVGIEIIMTVAYKKAAPLSRSSAPFIAVRRMQALRRGQMRLSSHPFAAVVSVFQSLRSSVHMTSHVIRKPPSIHVR